METTSTISRGGEILRYRSSSSVVKEGPRFYRPELDVLRFCAFLAVFVHHGIYNLSPLLSRCGGFGLSFFFFLSAFLITELLQREVEITGTVGIHAFYVRRILRIWPLYFAALLCAVVVGHLLPSHHISYLFVLSYLFMLGNVYIGRYGFPATFIGYLWSISIEEQFYMVWPLLNRRLTRGMLAFSVATLLPVGALAVLVLAYLGETPAQGIWTNSLVEVQIFALGALMALVLRSRIPKVPVQLRVALLVGGSSLWLATAALSGIDDRVPRDGIGPMFGYWGVGVGCICFLLSVLGLNKRVIPSSLVYLGKISYGLYVYHQISLEIASNVLNRIPCMDSTNHHVMFGIGHLTLGMSLTVALAALSYRFFERPFLRWKDKFTIVRSRAA